MLGRHPVILRSIKKGLRVKALLVNWPHFTPCASTLLLGIVSSLFWEVFPLSNVQFQKTYNCPAQHLHLHMDKDINKLAIQLSGWVAFIYVSKPTIGRKHRPEAFNNFQENTQSRVQTKGKFQGDTAWYSLLNAKCAPRKD